MESRPVQVIVQAQRTNGLGTAGFVVSLISFFCLGLTAPVGLFLSAIGLLFPPRGMAFAGVVLGALGSWWLVVVGLAVIAPLLSLPPLETPSGNAPAAATPDIAMPAPPNNRQPELPPEERDTVVGDLRDAPSNTDIPPNFSRRWTAASGGFTIDAEFVSFGNGIVKLRRDDGRVIEVPLDKLSTADAQWIRDR